MLASPIIRRVLVGAVVILMVVSMILTSIPVGR